MVFLIHHSLLRIFLLIFCATCSMHAATSFSPYQVKAAFLYNFIKFVDWPENAFPTPQSPYVIGVLGKDPFGTVLDDVLRGKSVNGRPVIVKRLETDEQTRICHIVFVCSSERRRWNEIRQILKNYPVLTVSETPGFAESGGIVNFFQEGNKVRFEINIDAARRAGLRIDSTVLNLAKIVRDE
jgi:hypothetical protein